MDPDIEEFFVERTVIPLMGLKDRLQKFEAEYLELLDESYLVPEIWPINDQQDIVERFYSEMERMLDAYIRA